MLRNKPKRLRKATKKYKIMVTLFLIFLVAIIISSYYIIRWFRDNQETKEIADEISESITVIEEDDKIEYKIDFEALKAKNPDTVAFLKVNGTDIEYVVVKGEDNSYYLTHSFDKSNNLAGWVFADYRNKFDGTDKNIILYGHNRRDGSIFCSLKNVLNRDWYGNEENHKIRFITELEDCEYEVFSVYQTDKENFETNIDYTDKEFENYINEIKNNSIYDFDVDVTNADNILTLSTCADDKQYRVILHAKKVEQ